MGEVPIAVIKTLPTLGTVVSLEDTLRASILKEFGPSYALAGVILLEDLGIQDFPLTASGKIRKAELKLLVSRHLQTLEHKQSQNSRNSVIPQLVDIWSRVLGHPIDENYHLLADSLTVMRFCYEIEKVTGRKLSVAQVYANEMIREQAKLLDDGATPLKKPSSVQNHAKTLDGPPSAQDMVPTFGDLDSARRAPEKVRPALEALKFRWEDDVEAVYRNNEMVGEFWSSSQRSASSNIRWLYEIESITATRLRQALEEALTRHSTLRSISVKQEGQTPIHVVMKPGQRLFDMCIEQGNDVGALDDVRALQSNMELGFAGPPGPSFPGRYRAHPGDECSGFHHVCSP